MEAFVAIIDSMARENGFKKGEFATTIWPDISPMVAVNRWKYMRIKSHITGHPQGVLLSDALRMSEILGVDLPYVLLRARTMADEKMKASGQEKPQAKPPREKQTAKKARKGKDV
jgi:hypothetical protein